MCVVSHLCGSQPPWPEEAPPQHSQSPVPPLLLPSYDPAHLTPNLMSSHGLGNPQPPTARWATNISPPNWICSAAHPMTHAKPTRTEERDGAPSTPAQRDRPEPASWGSLRKNTGWEALRQSMPQHHGGCQATEGLPSSGPSGLTPRWTPSPQQRDTRRKKRAQTDITYGAGEEVDDAPAAGGYNN